MRISAYIIALVTGTICATAEASPKREQQAAALEQKALRTYVAGDLESAVRLLEQAVRICEGGCSAKTKSHLHVSIGTVLGVGDGDYASAKKAFMVALQLDPDARLRTVTTPELTQAFEDAKKALSAGQSPDDDEPKPPPPEKEKKPAGDKSMSSVHDLFKPDEKEKEKEKEKEPSPTTKKVEAVVLPDVPPAERPRLNWFSIRPVVDFAFLGDANVCSPGAPAGYYCTDERNQPYTGTPQPNDKGVARGFAFSMARLVLGYERVFFDRLTAGAFVGVGLNFAPAATGRPKNASPINAELRATYTFGEQPYVDLSPQKWQPFVFASLGTEALDTHVVVRVYEIPCAPSPDKPACKRDLNAFRLSSGLFGSIGGGVRYHVEGRHALRAGIRTTLLFGSSLFVVSPEIAYEFGI